MNKEEILHILDKLSNLMINKDLLQESQIHVIIGKISKNKSKLIDPDVQK